ncbi:MAG: LysM peptidoglycan-binding domain-containing protein, partial [Simkania sp.]|nr:LysM peptidoglycan-binding domain-containing protein [Simkania sp.]
PTGEIQNIGQFLSGFENSKLAGYLLVALDPDHPYLRFSDEKLESFIGLLDQQTAEVELFLNRIATSARSDHIRELAKARIQSGGKVVRVSSQEYVVQKGDSLWGVSRHFDVSMEKIREANQLQSDVLTPGQRLQIPHAQHN